MAENNQQPCFSIVELSADVRARTSLPPVCHSALRAGFEGYSVNPRWNGTKLRAWRLGQEWRQALNRGEMLIRPSDQLLLSPEELAQGESGPAAPETCSKPETANSEGTWRSLLGWSRKKLALS